MSSSNPEAEDIDVLTMTKTIFLLLSLWAAGVSSSVVEKRLVSANTCPDKERLYHARVVYTPHSGTTITCGGTLIHKQWVITASHCYGGRDGKLKVELGTHPAAAVKQQMHVVKIKIYASSDKEEPVLLLKLSDAVKNIVPAELPSGSCMSPSDGDELQVSGRGATTAEGGPGVKDLMCLDITVLSKEHCKDLSGTKFEKYKNILCGGGINNAEIKACKGDSGSGLLKKQTVSKSSFFFFTKEEVADVLYGVLISGDDVCDDKFVFADICAKRIRKWIKTTVGI